MQTQCTLLRRYDEHTIYYLDSFLVNKDLISLNTSHGLLKHSYKGAKHTHTHTHSHTKSIFISNTFIYTHIQRHTHTLLWGLAKLVSCCTIKKMVVINNNCYVFCLFVQHMEAEEMLLVLVFRAIISVVLQLHFGYKMLLCLHTMSCPD